jgi:glycosyltransferase involved in cell wall biosynthesis
MNILHNLDNSNRGGIQEMILRLYTWSRHRHDFWAADGTMAEQMRRAGMVLWNGGPPDGAEYDVVVGHTVGGWSNNNTADWAHERGARFVEVMHSIATSPTDPSRLDAFVSVSILADQRNQQIAPARRHVIYPPVNVMALEVPAGRDGLIGRLSRLAHEKRPREFGLLAREFPQRKFVIAGDGPALSSIDPADNLYFSGWVTDLPGFYSQLSLFVFPTQDECNCVSVAQAQAAGVPVICQDIPALRETTGGFATFCNSHDDFVQAIHAHLDNPYQFREQTALAQAWAQRMYDYPITVGAWDVLLEGLA